MAENGKKGLQILQLQAENFKALTAVDITPKENVVVISGANGQGKSSILDSIWMGIDAAGFMKASKTIKPIKDGAKRGVVTLTLGNGNTAELVVTRKINPSGITVEVATPEGAKFTSPQAILDALTGAISFDPLGFAMLPEKKQVEQLLSVVPIDLDLDAWAMERKNVFDTRTTVNRNCGDAEAVYRSLPVPDPETPDKEVSAAEILEKLQEAQAKNEGNDLKRRTLEEARLEVRGMTAEKDRAIGVKEDLERQMAELSDKLTRQEQTVKLMEKEIDTKVEDGRALAAEVEALEDTDLEPFKEQMKAVEDTNKKVREKIRRNEARETFKALEKEALKLTDELADLDEKKAKAIREAQFPVPGLGFDEHGITFNGIPFAQASSAQRLRVSLAIAISLNPRLRVLRVQDGSLLDSKSMAVIEEMCAEHGYQVWIEKVDESGKMGIYIEEGAVAAEN